MNIVTLDFETFYGDDYTLSKMTTESYIRDPRFEAHGCAVKMSPDLPARWWDRDELPEFFAEIDWSRHGVLAHHSQFDGLILSHHYGIKPRFWFDTLSMARLLLGNHLSVGLDALAKHFGLKAKTVPYNLFRGKRWHELDKATQQLVGDGACHDVELTWELFKILGKDFPRSQYGVVDCLTRMFTEPMLEGDIGLFRNIWRAEYYRKKTLLTKLGITEADLQSAERFADILRGFGIEPAMKDGKNKKIYAFAKTDTFMQELLQGEDETVADLANARLGVKSTIQQTRAETLGRMARRGPLCVYVRPYGAKTTRPSGGDKSNFLNFKKQDPDLPPDDSNTSLKRGIKAPPGFLLAPIDSAQIECRIVNFVAGQHDVVERFRNGEDPYVNVASAFYGYAVNKKDHPTQRQVGKVIELQAGYGSGGEKIRATLRNKAKIFITAEEGIKARDAYRDTHPAVVAFWKTGNDIIARMARGETFAWGPATIGDKRMWLPNGCPLNYQTLEWYHDGETGEKYWRVQTRDGWQKLYGAKLVENLCQGLAWAIVSAAMVRIHRLGYRSHNCPYDELLLLLPDDGRAIEHAERCKAEMVKPPAWLPDLPLDAEYSIGERYSK